MDNRSVSWLGTLSERILSEKPVAFSASEVSAQEELFAHRAALFYTPTDSIPGEFIGYGPIDITIPIATADYTDAVEFQYPISPRFWVDLIQRQTMKIRWQPILKAHIMFTRYDYYVIRDDHFISGIKALLDALKEKASGRIDGHWLYYFGAIIDDSSAFITLEWDQQCINHPSEARTRIQVIEI